MSRARDLQDPMVRMLEGQWHKILALVMRKLGHDSVPLMPGDCILPPEGLNVVVHEHVDSLEVRIVSDAEADRLRRRRNMELGRR